MIRRTQFIKKLIFISTFDLHLGVDMSVINEQVVILYMYKENSIYAFEHLNLIQPLYVYSYAWVTFFLHLCLICLIKTYIDNMNHKPYTR